MNVKPLTLALAGTAVGFGSAAGALEGADKPKAAMPYSGMAGLTGGLAVLNHIYHGKTAGSVIGGGLGVIGALTASVLLGKSLAD